MHNSRLLGLFIAAAAVLVFLQHLQARPQSAVSVGPLPPAAAGAALDRSDQLLRAMLASWRSADANPGLFGPFYVDSDDSSATGMLTTNYPVTITTVWIQNVGDTDVEIHVGGAVFGVVRSGTGAAVRNPSGVSGDVEYRGIGNGSRLLFVAGFP